MSFLEDLASPATLAAAWGSVAAKRSMGGIDRVTVDDFAADLESNLRRLGDEIVYEEQLRTPSEGAESPSWRERLKHQVEAVREKVMAGEPAPLHQWPGEGVGASGASALAGRPALPLTSGQAENGGRLADGRIRTEAL